MKRWNNKVAMCLRHFWRFLLHRLYNQPNVYRPPRIAAWESVEEAPLFQAELEIVA